MLLRPRQFLFFVVFGVGVIFALSALLFSRPTIKNLPIRIQGPILFFGDSLVAGAGASEGGSLPDRLSKILDEPVLNFGESGNTTTDGLARVEIAREAHPRLVIVLLGGNDFLRRIDRVTTQDNLKKIVTAFQEDGAAVLLLGVRSGILRGGSEELYREVAKQTGAAYEDDVLKGIFGHPELMSDAIHPNDAGYEKIAHRLGIVIRELLNDK